MSKKSKKRQREVEAEENDAKRVRSNDGSPVSTTTAKIVDDGSSAKAQLAAKMAAMRAKIAAAAAAGSDSKSVTQQPVNEPSKVEADDSVEAKRAAAQQRIAEMRARIAAQRGQPTEAPAVAQRAPVDSRTIAEVRAKAAQHAQRSKSAAATPAVPIVSQRTEGTGARGGLGIGLHPSLLTQEPVSSAKGKSQGPKFSTTRGNRAPSPEKVNPYLAEVDGEDSSAVADPKLERRARARMNKVLTFAPHGKYIAQAAALKPQAKLEELKRRVALEAKQVAIEEASDKSFLVLAPPEVEWWDEGLLPIGRQTYDEWEKYNRIEAADSVITKYVQHPVLIAAPQDKFVPAPKPMMLTRKEMEKLRRQRRAADRKEVQAKVRLGVIEPPPDKVKKSNMMRVFGEQAVNNPTAVEARVNREIAQRASNHERANEERKLTKEERAEKLKKQQAEDEAKGIKIVIFKVDNLSSNKHRFQIDIGAKQNALTGIVILHPDMNLVIIEGGTHSINNYKKLMLNRIKWSENVVQLSGNSNPTFTATAKRDRDHQMSETPSAIDTWLNPLTEQGELKDLSENKCLLVWEGDERQRIFRRWGSRVCYTDGEARDVLGRNKMENMWALAKGSTE